MLDVDDIKKLTQVFATKEDIDEIKEKMVTKQDNSRILEGVDKVYGELKTMREEQAAHRAEHDRVNERLNRVESGPAIAHKISK